MLSRGGAGRCCPEGGGEGGVVQGGRKVLSRGGGVVQGGEGGVVKGGREVLSRGGGVVTWSLVAHLPPSS